MDENQMERIPGTCPDAVVIRPATLDDVERIGQLWESLVAYHHNLDSELPTVGRGGAALYGKRISDRLDDTHTHTLVADVDGEIVGFVMGLIVDMVPEMFTPETSGFLADIFVVSQMRRCGIGRQLVDALQEWFRSRGVTHMEWYVAAHNTAGIAFWRRIGGRDNMIRMRANL